MATYKSIRNFDIMTEHTSNLSSFNDAEKNKSTDNNSLPEWETIVTGITLTTIIILTVIGNILVALSVFTSKYLRLVQNYYIVSLAVADMTVAIFVMPFSVVNIIEGNWIFGKHVCKMWLTMDIMCCTSSILNLCIIALDRYWSISSPIEHAHKRTKQHVLCFIAAIWVLSFLISSPPLIGWNNWPPKFDKNAKCELTDDLGYVAYSAMGSFFIPLFVMTIVYIKIYTVMKKRLRQRAFIDTVYPLSMSESIMESPNATKSTANGNTLQSSFTQSMVSRLPNLTRLISYDTQEVPTASNVARSIKQEICVATDPKIIGIRVKHKNETNETAIEAVVPNERTDLVTEPELEGLNTVARNTNSDLAFRSFTNAAQFHHQKQKIVQQRERRAARTLSVIMGVFVICWLPFFIMYITSPFCGSLCPSKKVQDFITWLGYINSGLNPIIYTIFNVDYRKAFKRLLGFGNI